MSSQGTPTNFVHPLAIDGSSPFVIYDFGAFAPDPNIVAQADRLEVKLALAVGDLPPAMAKEAAGELKMYAGHRPRFIDLFYVPIWSFLHWIPAAHPGIDAGALEKAQEAHALSLFLHLWDDHLSDAQLPPNLMRLQLRAVAWERYHAAARALAAKVPSGDEIVTRLINGYLTSCHQPPPATDQKSFCDRFVRQIGIWLVVPTLLGHLTGGPNVARELCAVIEAFAVAWRMIDDVQDINKDIVSGQQNAVWFELNAPGRQMWEHCRVASTGGPRPEPTTWLIAATGIRGDALQSTLRQVIGLLSQAETLAGKAGWAGLAAEMAACRNLRGLKETGLPI